MIGSNITVEGTVKSIYLETILHSKYSFNLKIGTMESSCTTPRNITNDSIAFNEVLKITCSRSNLINNQNICEIILNGHSGNRRLKVGSIKVNVHKIILNSPLIYKFEGVSNQNGRLQFSINITNDQIKQIQFIGSPKSQTSLAELQEFHLLLNGQKRTNKKTLSISKNDHPSSQIIPLNKKYRKQCSGYSEKQKILSNSIFSEQEGDNKSQSDKNYEINQQKLRQLHQDNKRLKNIVAYQRKLNQQKDIQHKQQLRNLKKQLYLLQFNNLPNKRLLKEQQKQKQNSNIRQQVRFLQPVKKKYEKIQRKPSNQRSKRLSFSNYKKSATQTQISTPNQNICLKVLNNVESLSQLTQQNQFYYKQIKQHQTLCDNLKQQLKAREINEAILQQQNEELKQQNRVIKKKILQIEHSSNELDYSKLFHEKQSLQKHCRQLQRRLVESIKAIDEFRNQAMKARNQVLQKEQIITQNHYQQKTSLSCNSKNEKNILINRQGGQSLRNLKEVLRESIKERESTIQKLKKMSRQQKNDKNVILWNIQKTINDSYMDLLRGGVSKRQIIKQKIQLSTNIKSCLNIPC